MDPYMFKRNREGIHIINISKTWEKIMLAARIIASIKNPKDILVSSKRKWLVSDFSRSSQAESTLRELSSSSPPTPVLTTWEESGFPAP